METQYPSSPIVACLRSATGEIHRRIEQRLDTVARLSDPGLRNDMVWRFAALHLPAYDALAPQLGNVAGLDFPGQTRALLLVSFSSEESFPAFPQPASRAEALGMLYVLHGSMLGGRLISRALLDRGLLDSSLAFLDPHGARTGGWWRAFISVLARETEGDCELIGAACEGARSAFLHSEQVLCGDLS